MNRGLVEGFLSVASVLTPEREAEVGRLFHLPRVRSYARSRRSQLIYACSRRKLHVEGLQGTYLLLDGDGFPQRECTKVLTADILAASLAAVILTRPSSKSNIKAPDSVFISTQSIDKSRSMQRLLPFSTSSSPAPGTSLRMYTHLRYMAAYAHLPAGLFFMPRPNILRCTA